MMIRWHKWGLGHYEDLAGNTYYGYFEAEKPPPGVMWWVFLGARYGRVVSPGKCA